MLWLASDSYSSLSMVICDSLLRVGVSEVALQIEDLDVDERDCSEDNIGIRDDIELWELSICS